MGLDITFYRNLKKVPDSLYDEDDNPAPIVLYASPGHEANMDSLEPGAYEGDISGGFRAGSYSGYNLWREQLCKMALDTTPETVWDDTLKYAGRPFFELINFSDCEGTIGPVTSKKLYQDFVKFDKQAKEYSDYFYQLYCDWKEAFKTASETNGAVSFH